jgi:hypothetical protein
MSDLLFVDWCALGGKPVDFEELLPLVEIVSSSTT